MSKKVSNPMPSPGIKKPKPPPAPSRSYYIEISPCLYCQDGCYSCPIYKRNGNSKIY